MGGNTVIEAMRTPLGADGKSAKGKVYKALVLKFHKPSGVHASIRLGPQGGRGGDRGALHGLTPPLRRRSAVPAVPARGHPVPASSLDPRAWREDYSFKVVERAYNASAAAASGSAGSSSSACLGGVRRGYARLCVPLAPS